jgi:type II secretion system protein J
MITRRHNAAAAIAAFTLIEMIVSAALMAIVLASGYACLSAGVATRKLIEARSEGVQSARVALALMAADLRQAVPMYGDFEFLGMRRTMSGADADNIDFSTRNYMPRAAREADYCEISYFLEPDPLSDSFILRRRRDATPDPEPLAGGAREEIVRGVKSLRLEYYDGIEWWDDWGDPEGKTNGMTYPPLNSSGMPEAVRITLTFDPETPRKKRDPSGASATANESDSDSETHTAMTFQTVARLDLADYFARQTRQSNSNNNNNNNTQQEANGVPQQGGPQ